MTRYTYSGEQLDLFDLGEELDIEQALEDQALAEQLTQALGDHQARLAALLAVTGDTIGLHELLTRLERRRATTH